MPAVAAHQRAWQRVERAHEEAVEEESLPAAVQARLHRESLRDDADVPLAAEQGFEFAPGIFLEDGRVLVFEADLHQLGESVQPGHAVVDLEQHFPTRLQDAAALVDELLI